MDRPPSETVKYENQWLSLVEAKSDKFLYAYLRLKSRGARIVLMDDMNRTLLVRQFRYPLSRLLWEIRAGSVEPGETTLDAAKRELQEESGLGATTWRPLGVTAGLVNVTDFTATTFLATEPFSIHKDQRTSADRETTDARYFSPAEMDALIDSGDLCDDKTLAAVFLARRMLTREVPSD